MSILPDPDNHAEMWMVIQMVGAVARADPWVFFFILLLLIGYCILRCAYALVTYLITTYRIRLGEGGWHVRYFRIALGIAAGVALIGGLLSATLDDPAIGIAVLAVGFGVFAVFVAGLDWYVDRRTPTPTPELEGITYDDIVAFQRDVKQAQEAKLM